MLLWYDHCCCFAFCVFRGAPIQAVGSQRNRNSSSSSSSGSSGSSWSRPMKDEKIKIRMKMIVGPRYATWNHPFPLTFNGERAQIAALLTCCWRISPTRSHRKQHTFTHKLHDQARLFHSRKSVLCSWALAQQICAGNSSGRCCTSSRRAECSNCKLAASL